MNCFLRLTVALSIFSFSFFFLYKGYKIHPSLTLIAKNKKSVIKVDLIYVILSCVIISLYFHLSEFHPFISSGLLYIRFHPYTLMSLHFHIFISLYIFVFSYLHILIFYILTFSLVDILATLFAYS